MIVPGKYVKNVIGDVLRCARIDFVATEGLASVKICSTICPPVLSDTISSYACKKICQFEAFSITGNL